ncbi:MAG TPA: NUDIX hydrolase [Candidatus Obscuribacterales bacterium]
MPNKRNGAGDPTAMRVVAGVVVFRFVNKRLQVLLVHQTDKHKALWSIPKGGVRSGEDFEKGARREAQEETNVTLHQLDFLGYVDYGTAKRMYCFMGACPPQFDMKAKLPEIDKVGFFEVAIAKKMVDKRQRAMIRTMQKILAFARPHKSTA